MSAEPILLFPKEGKYIVLSHVDQHCWSTLGKQMLSSRWRLNIVWSRSQETNVNVQRHTHIHTPTQRNITYAEPTACVTMLYLISPPGTVWLSCCRPALPWWGWGRGRLGPPWCSRFLRMSWRHREQIVHSSYIDRLRYRGNSSWRRASMVGSKQQWGESFQSHVHSINAEKRLQLFSNAQIYMLQLKKILGPQKAASLWLTLKYSSIGLPYLAYCYR